MLDTNLSFLFSVCRSPQYGEIMPQSCKRIRKTLAVHLGADVPASCGERCVACAVKGAGLP